MGKNLGIGTLVLALLLAIPAARAEVGFREITAAPEDGLGAVEGGIWYPTDVPAGPQRPARSPPLGGQGRLALVLLIPGAGGDYLSHRPLAIALAEAGFVAASFNPPATRGTEQNPLRRMAQRARGVSRGLDYLLAAWPDRARLDPGRIGAFGYSAGGLTLTLLLGGLPDPQRFAEFCAAEQQDPLCRPSFGGAVAATPAAAIAALRPDRRIRAAVLAAPALGFLFSREGLARLPHDLPLQIWRPDEDAVLRAPHHADALRQALPAPVDFRTIPGAGHFVFLPPCPPGPDAQTAALCRDSPGFDRAAFQRDFHAAVVAFFRRALAP